MLKYKLVSRDGDVCVYEYWDPVDEGPSGRVSYNTKTQEIAILFLPEWDKYKFFLSHMVHVIRYDIAKGVRVESGSCAWY
ncbi:MAG: hypothetical protein K6F83_06305 [Clostridiales bacterium]|nr:hypothetical protein [Clostridiales bacterium]